MRVDFPAPFSPQMACTSPGRTFRLTDLSAWTPGKDFSMFRISRTCSPMVPASCQVLR